jgi:CBS domain-containing protein
MNQIPLRVGDYMTSDPLTVSPDTEVNKVVRLLIDNDVSGVVVTDAGGAVVGVVTERDCIAVASAAGYFGQWGGPVSKYMSAPVETVATDDNLVDVAARMAGSRYRRFPVVDQGRLVGLLSRRDVLRAIDNGSW